MRRTFDHATVSRFQTVLGSQATGLQTFDQATYDSLGAFVRSELEAMDPTMHEPLIAFTWSRDIDLRTDVSLGHEFTSFVTNTYGLTGGTQSQGKSWAAKNQTETPNVALDLNRQRAVLGPWAHEVSYTVFELASAALLQRPLDSDKVNGLKMKWQQDADEQTYVGDTQLGGGVPGLVNNPAVATANVANGASGTPGWATKTPAEVLRDLNDMATASWTAAGWTSVPNRIGLPPNKFAYIANQANGSIGNMSILSYFLENNIGRNQGMDVQIVPIKWLVGRGAGGTDRMIAYTKSYDTVRLPIVPCFPLDTQRQGLYMRTPYVGSLGQVEFVRPERFAYRDGI